jgi:hypothetical protein
MRRPGCLHACVEPRRQVVSFLRFAASSGRIAAWYGNPKNATSGRSMSSTSRSAESVQYSRITLASGSPRPDVALPVLGRRASGPVARSCTRRRRGGRGADQRSCATRSPFTRAETSLRVDIAVVLVAVGENDGARAHPERAEHLATEIGSV